MVAVSAVSASVWSVAGRSSRDRQGRILAGTVQRNKTSSAGAASNQTLAQLPETDPRRGYFGVPVEGNVVAYIVDSDPAMAPYIGHLSYVTSLVSEANKVTTRRHGVVRPHVRHRFSLTEVAAREPTLEGAEPVLSPKLPPERIDFSEALSVAANWYADQIFMVVARPIGSSEIEALAQHAEQTGAVTNVLALGPAAGLDLSPIAEATGGRSIPMTDEQFAEWVSRYKETAGAPD
jgi:hypothetical protein